MAQVTVYTMRFCPYCVRAKQLLGNRGVAFKEVLVADDDEAAWDALEKRSGMKTMPQIYLAQADGSEKLIGGYQDLAALDAKDQLSSLKG